MNTEIIVHPKLQHYALAATNLDATIDWVPQSAGHERELSFDHASRSALLCGGIREQR